MNKQEFCTRVQSICGKEPILSREEYTTIEYVYNYHPSIDAVKGKEQIAYLYTNFGMRVVYDMLPTAKLAEQLENEVNNTRRAYELAKKKYDNLKNCTEE